MHGFKHLDLFLGMRRTHLTIYLLLYCCASVYAQREGSFSFRHITYSDGLLHNNVFGISQDSRGFVWILTNNGLQRFDGSRFVSYDSLLNDPSQGQMNGGNLYADKVNESIRVLRKNKLISLDLASNRFIRYGEKEVLSNSSKFTFYTDDHHNKWLAGDKGIFVLPNGKNTLTTAVYNIYPLQAHFSNLIAKDSLRKQTWIIAGPSVFLLDESTHYVYSKEYNPIHHPLLRYFDSLQVDLRFMMIDSHGNYWIATWGDAFYRFNSTTGKVQQYQLSTLKKAKYKQSGREEPLLLNAFFEDRQENVWLATENAGLLLYRHETDTFESIVVDRENIHSVQYNFKINCIAQDREDNLWLGTDKGISIFNPYKSYFTAIRHLNHTPSVLNNEILSSIQAANGDVLIGTWGGGMTVYDDKLHFKKNLRNFSVYDLNKVWCFTEQSGNEIWVGCQHGYIQKYNPYSGSIKVLHPPELENSTVRCMIKDEYGKTWFGLHNGHVACWDSATQKFYPFRKKGSDNTTGNAPVVKMFIDQKGTFWVSTESGFKLFDPSSMTYVKTFYPFKDGDSVNNGTCTFGVEAVDDSTLLVGTAYGGLMLFNTYQQKFSPFLPENDLHAGTVYALKKDAAGFIWFTTDYGLHKLNVQTRKWTSFNLPPGMINSSFNSVDFYTLKNGMWLTASTTEVVGFRPTAILEKKTGINYRVEIAGLKVFDRAVFTDSFIATRQPIQLAYNQNFLTIEFALLSFSGLQQVKYFYKLSGIDKDWVGTDRNYAGYTNLQPGSYTFFVKAAQGVTVTPVTFFTIVITPPFWQTWWFRLLCGLLVTVLGTMIIRRRIKLIRKQAELKQHIAETEMIALKAQMNPHFIFNCLASIDNFIQIGERDKATIYLSKFAKLIRAILQNSKHNLVPCWKDIDTLRLYLELEALRFSNKFSYSINVDPDIQYSDYAVPPLIIQPFVENAIHHGLLNKTEGDKKLEVEIKASEEHIYYRIQDNGIGRARSAANNHDRRSNHESMGMQITRQRIHLFNNKETGAVNITDLYNEHGESDGTRVEVYLIHQKS